MTVLITLTIAGTDSGPFSLYSNVDGYTTPFETGVLKSLLVAGYTSVLVPTGTTIIQVRSLGTCTNSVNLSVDLLGTSTTTTTTLPTTTTTTTTADISCTEISIDVSTNCPDQDYALVQYTDCEGNVQTVETSSGELLTFCMLNYPPPVYLCGTGGFQYGEACSTT